MRLRAVSAVLAVGLVLAGCSPAPAPAPAAPSGRLAPQPVDAGLSRPKADPVYPAYGHPSVDVLGYDLALTWTPPQRLAGTATLTIRAATAIREIGLDFLDTYAVDGVTVDGRPARWTLRDNDLTVTAALAQDARATLVVRYRGTPTPVPMRSGRNDFPEGLGLRATADGGAWTMQEPYGAFTWYPANDHPSDEAVYDVAVTVPKGWSGVAHGQLVRVESGRAGDTFRWRAADPVASYLATLAVGRYTKVTDTGPRGVPITYWLRTGLDEGLEPTLRKTPALLGWLERRFGPYPFPSAGVVMVDSLSAMETQQMITLGARIGVTRGAPSADLIEEILLHELAHQWFGDAVTPTDWTGMWLNEGFAMYVQWLWAVDTRGQSHERWRKSAYEGDRRSRPAAGPPGRPHPDHFGEHNVYFGPALMLDEIHRAVGDDAFFAFARDWVQRQRNRPVDRAGFIAFLNQHTGRNFTALVNRWLDSPTTPALT